MGTPDCRGDYSLLAQLPDDQLPAGTSSAISPPPIPGDNRFKTNKPYRPTTLEGFADIRSATRPRVAPVVNKVAGLQRQSSDSSFGGSSLSSDYYAPTLSAAATSEFDPSGELFRANGLGTVGETGMDGSGWTRSWAQQTEESYQLQLALTVRVSSDATCADDPNFLDPVPDVSAPRTASASAEPMSHRFWVNGCLSYFDKVPDGFYLVDGMNPYMWTMCTDLQESGRIPSIESLKSIDLTSDSSIDVVLVDLRYDLSLKDLLTTAQRISTSCITTHEVAGQLAELVCAHMGGAVSVEESELLSTWRECSDNLKDCFKSVVFPIGSLSFGLCKHRSLLFKLLADAIDLPCRVAKGCKYCARDDASSCLVRFGIDREYTVDLMGKPGCFRDPDSSLNGPSSILVSSPLRFPVSKPVDINFSSLAKQYFADCLTLGLAFDDSVADDVKGRDANEKQMIARGRISEHSRNMLPGVHVGDTQLQTSGAPSQNQMIPLSADSKKAPVLSNTSTGFVRGIKYLDKGHAFPSESNEDLSFNMEDLEIPWDDLVLKEKIGSVTQCSYLLYLSLGSNLLVWLDARVMKTMEVAVKILTEQDFPEDASFQKFLREFLREVWIMKSLRHPNIVLFMGAVTQRPHLSIVTEYLSRGSLFRLLHRQGAREALDERRRLNMAYDVAKGMNYLHKRNPPIVHRDLKSPNLLVDKKFTVKVADFGLSRLKTNTYISSKSAAGTPEWMAPEVLRDEPSNEKSDVYSFGVILWELVTMQQPWSNLNAAQVVAAVGFRGKRLEIPRELNSQVASIIEACWAIEPWKRPSFSTIMEMLRPLIKVPLPQSSNVNKAAVG
uniref:Protein kinase domain-containing protein n=1 Tax=Kalanchoe fedtschenkoi TaxID=63787 RepID=A0A7N0UWI0_KALFE